MKTVLVAATLVLAASPAFAVEVAKAPEPGSFGLVAVGIALLVAKAMRRK